MRGFIVGSIIGVATSLFLMPQVNKNTGKKVIDIFGRGVDVLKK